MKTALCLFMLALLAGCTPPAPLPPPPPPLVFGRYTNEQLEVKINNLGRDGSITKRELQQLLGDMNASR